MGEVYRAKDTRLDRTVAIKILPEHLSSNKNLRDRFEREARAVSALNHPSICTLHDVGHQDGVHFLVMEYIEGETLAHRLEKGAIPLDQTLRYGVQIANALDKAHKQGVVHRDLKPGNIMITKSGIKLLDFGLAKSSLQSGVLSQQENLSAFATEARQLTAEGMIIGTLQYMSPEQLEGKETDTRTDIFAFGTVLYEMVTGKKAFTGKSQASLISAILKDDPVPVSQVQPLAPPGLDRVVKTCLAKDPDDRWQSAHDVATELMWNVEQTSQSSAGRIKQSGSNRWAWAIASLLLLTTVLAVLYAKYSDRSDQKQELSIFSIAPPSGYTFNPDSCFAISPDGRKLTFSASDKEGRLYLWLRDFGSARIKKANLNI